MAEDEKRNKSERIGARSPTQASSMPNDIIVSALEELLSDPEGYYNAHPHTPSESEAGFEPPAQTAEKEAPRDRARSSKRRPERPSQSVSRINAAKHGVKVYGFSFVEGVLFTLLHIVLFVVTFLVVDWVTYIPGSTGAGELRVLENVSIRLISLPLWLNLGCVIGAACFLARLILDGWKYGFGLIVGITVSSTALLSQSLEGSIGSGLFFGFLISIFCLIVVMLNERGRLTGKEVLRISCVAGLAVAVIIGLAINFLAALLIGLAIALLTRLMLWLLVVLG